MGNLARRAQSQVLRSDCQGTYATRRRTRHVACLRGCGRSGAESDMSWLNLFRRRRHVREMDAEMRFHIDMEAADLERRGLSPEEARRRALATFGGVQRYKEEGIESRGGTRIEDL